MSQHIPEILPIPQSICAGEGCFTLNAETLILLLPDAAAGAFASARSLADEIATQTGLALRIVKAARPPRRENVILLCDDLEAAQAFLGTLPLVAFPADRGPEAHAIAVTPDLVVAGGTGEVALHLAVQSLRQIVRLQGTTWAACSIADWPALPYRGLMLDVSRGKVPTLATLREIVDALALFKMNVLQLYTEHTFDFSSHPAIGLGTDPLTSEDMLALDAYAREHYVELIPNLNCFGHCAHLLSLPEYAHLAEAAVPWTLTPADPGTYTLLGDLLDDMLPAFSSRTFNAGCDETWDLGKGRSAAMVAEEGLGRVYLGHLLRLHEMAQARGYRIQFWGDILLHHPELVTELPEDVTLLDWHYEAQESYPSLDVFAGSGRPFWVCPGTSSWNTLFPRIENANGNIRNLVRQGVERGATGMLNTDWGDHGHYQPLGQCWYGYALGGAQAWSGGTTPDDEFDARFGRVWFGEDGEAVVQAMRALGRLNALPGMPLPNNSLSMQLLLEDPLAGAASDSVPVETLQEIVTVTRQAEATFRAAWQESPDRLSLEEMSLSARWMAYAARKALCSRALREALAAGKAAAAAEGRDALRALELELAPLRDQFVRQWRLRARDSEIGQHLGALAALGERFALARGWLDQIAAGAREWDRETYLAATPRYEILGQRFWRQMRELDPTL